MFDKLFSLAFVALHETVPFNDDQLIRPKLILDECSSILAGEKNYLASKTYDDYSTIISCLKKVFIKGYPLPKHDALATRLRSEKYKSICIIVPERSDKKHVQEYWQMWCRRQRLITQVYVLYPAEYYPALTTQFSATVVVGWLKRAIMRKILYGFNTQTYTILLYDYEKRWKNYDTQKWNSALDSLQNRKTIERSFATDKLHVSTSRFVPPEPVPADTPKADEFAEIEVVLRENKYRQYVANGGQKAANETAEAIPVNYVGGYLAFYRTGHKVISATNIIMNDADKIDAVLPEQLKMGDFVVVRETAKDLIREMADVILARSGKAGLREIRCEVSVSIRGVDMDVLFLCGVFAKENEVEVIAQAKKSVEFSANQMQLKLIRGLKEAANTQVISAPFIGHYPNQSRSLYFFGFAVPQHLCKYVLFNNIWGIRNLSRARALKKAVRGFALDGNGEKLIVVYSAHDPFLAAAAYAKKLNPKIRICLIAPDLPQYMNLEAKRGFLYDFFKQFDIKSIQKHIKSVDTSVVLTEAMAKALRLTDRPYAVAEGIVDSIPKGPVHTAYGETVNIVYAGKLYFRFGICSLVEAFSLLKDNNYRLILCGNGDAAEYLQKCAIEDPRIILPGQVSPEKVKEYISSAAVLVNPRPNNEEYTKYSFPSKDIEYLLSGKPTVAFLLDGMPKCYQDFLYVVDQNKNIPYAICAALKAAISAPKEETEKRHTRFLQYAAENLLASAIAEKIIRMNFNEDA